MQTVPVALCLILLGAVVGTGVAHAQGTPDALPPAPAELAALALPAGYVGPTPPVLPATMARDGEGRATVRAVRLTEAIRLDGALDEAIYSRLQPMTDFLQTEPTGGAPATEKTEVWIAFDDSNIYVSVRAHESQPDRMIVNEMRRDSNAIFQNENFQFAFDTFYDRKNSFAFQFNPIGGRMDGQVSNENQYNGDFNPVWRLAVQRTSTGWTGEAAVPFKSLRFQPGVTQVWGVQFRRINRWKNEVSYLTSVPDGSGNTGFQRVSRYATLVGIQAPSGSRALDLKPYVTSNLTTDRVSSPALSNKFGKDWGLDAKYAVTQNLSADFTYNTDFAQVEADEQQVNLTRFSLFFPEKRDFFLENQGVFTFGNINNPSNSDSPTLFYSRRIGLAGGLPVPLNVGGRLSGRLGRYTVGALNIQTDDVPSRSVPATDFGVVRVRRDILRRSAVGLLFTGRSHGVDGLGSTETYGADAAFAFYQNLFVNAFWAKTSTPGRAGDDLSYRTQMNYNGDRWGAQLEHVKVEPNFNPEVGFVRRVDFTKNRAMLRFSPRPRTHFTAVRKFGYQLSVELFDNHNGQLETRERRGEFYAEFQNSDRLEINYENTYELLLTPFELAREATIAPGGYDIGRLHVEYQLGQQRRASGTWFVEQGPFYDGTRTTVGFNAARVKMTPQFAIEPGLQVNRVRTPFGDFTSTLASSRITYTVTPLMFVSGLVQYNSSNSSLSTNVRFRWEYQPGSEFFLVYNDGRDTFGPGTPLLQNRQLVFKVNRLFRM